MDSNTTNEMLGTGAAIGSVLGAAAHYIIRLLFDRRKFKAEGAAQEIDNDTKAVELYEKFAAQMTPRLDALQAKQDQLIDQVATLKIENAELRSENITLHAENKALKQEVQGLRDEVAQLKEERK